MTTLEFHNASFGLERTAESMAAGDGITSPTQIFRQILLHLQGRLIWHRIQVREQLRQQPNAKILDYRSGIDPGL